MGKRDSNMTYITLELFVKKIQYIAGVAKVRPSKDFLQPLCQILDAQLSYLWHIYV